MVTDHDECSTTPVEQVVDAVNEDTQFLLASDDRDCDVIGRLLSADIRDARTVDAHWLAYTLDRDLTEGLPVELCRPGGKY